MTSLKISFSLIRPILSQGLLNMELDIIKESFKKHLKNTLKKMTQSRHLTKVRKKLN